MVVQTSLADLSQAELIELVASSKKQLDASVEECLKLDEAKATLQAANESLEAENEELKQKLAAAEDEQQDLPSFELEGIRYEVVVPRANVLGFGEVTAADIIGSKDIQAALVKRVSGVIRLKF